MSEAWGYAGAVLLLAATAPQIAKLLRTRRVDDFSYGFCALNMAGLFLLTVRSVELGETAFIVLNTATAGFWMLLLAAKLAQRLRDEPPSFDASGVSAPNPEGPAPRSQAG